MQISVPEDKKIKAIQLIQDMFGLVSLRMIQSLAGVLNFFTKAIPAGRSFLRRLYDLSIGLKFPSQHVDFGEGPHRDLHPWLSFLQDFNGSIIIKKIDLVTEMHCNQGARPSVFSLSVMG